MWDGKSYAELSKFVPLQAVKGILEEWGCSSTISTRSSMQVNGLLYSLVALQSRKEHQKHLKRRLCRSQGLSGNFGVRKNLLHLPRIEPQFAYRLAHSIITIDLSHFVRSYSVL